MFTDSDILLPDLNINDKYMFLKSEHGVGHIYKNIFIFCITGNENNIDDIKKCDNLYIGKHDIFGAYILNIFKFNDKENVKKTIIEAYVNCSIKQFSKIEQFLKSDESRITKTYNNTWLICSSN